jgi:hypothetical protein
LRFLRDIEATEKLGTYVEAHQEQPLPQRRKGAKFRQELPTLSAPSSLRACVAKWNFGMKQNLINSNQIRKSITTYWDYFVL